MAFPVAAITGLISFGKSIIGNWLERRTKKQEHKTKMVELRLNLKEKRLITQLESDVSIDQLNTENMATSWKDEFVLILFSIPVGMSFVPKLAPYVTEGFAALRTTPMWFQVIYVVMCLTIYGQRKLARLFAAKFLGGNGGNN